jgi:hypothetical protein
MTEKGMIDLFGRARRRPEAWPAARGLPCRLLGGRELRSVTVPARADDYQIAFPGCRSAAILISSRISG